jgi:3-dehydroquinate synthase
MVDTVRVDLGARSYDVRIGPGLLARAGEEIAPLLRRPRVAVLTETRVAEAHLMRCAPGWTAAGIAMEAHACRPERRRRAGRARGSGRVAARRAVERRDVVVAFGGGVIGDLAGFAAAVLRRGVRFVQMPDDASGAGRQLGRRQDRDQHAPRQEPRGRVPPAALVLADIDVLDTLPPRDFLAGYGEVVKYGLLGDAGFFDWLEANGPALAAGRGPAAACRPCGRSR